jgi:hypothetical protein
VEQHAAGVQCAVLVCVPHARQVGQQGVRGVVHIEEPGLAGGGGELFQGLALELA